MEQKGITGRSRELLLKKAPYGKHIIVSAIEHPAVKESALWLQGQGFEVDLAPVDARGFVQVEELKKTLASGYNPRFDHGRQQ